MIRIMDNLRVTRWIKLRREFPDYWSWTEHCEHQKDPCGHIRTSGEPLYLTQLGIKGK